MDSFFIHEQPLTTPLAACSGKEIVTPEWLLTLPKTSWNRPILRWLNNSYLLYHSPPRENNQEHAIEQINVRTGEHKILGSGSFPVPSPDTQWIAFVRGKRESKQLWIMDDNGKNLRQLSHIQGGLGDYYQYSFSFDWSPDSKKVAVAHQSHSLSCKRDEPFPSETKIEIIDIKTGESQLIASCDATIRFLSWFPNGEKLLFMKECIGSSSNKENDRAWIQSLHIKDGYLHTLAEFDGIQQLLAPTASPDGEQIAFMFDVDDPTFNNMPSLCLITHDSTNRNMLSSLTRLTHELKLYTPRWSHNGQHIYVLRAYGAYKQIYAIDVPTGKPTQITNAPLNIVSYALSSDGSQIGWIGQDAQGAHIIRVASSDGCNVRDLKLIPTVSGNMALSEVREISWQAPPDYPTRMQGLLCMPLNYKVGTAYPLIVDIHGGGEGASIYLSGGILVDSPLEWHMWAAKGYAIFIPEFRSSASFGSLAITRDALVEYNLIHCDVRDIEEGIDTLITQGIVDPERIAVIGHSAGGRRANWLTATTHRFRAIVSKEGWADEWIPSLCKPLRRIHQSFGGPPWEVPQNYQKNSALFHCQEATTPTLFLMGNPELGGADPHNTVHMLYNALKGQGVETEYIRYSDEGHNFEKIANRKDILIRSIAWIDKHMKARI